MTARRNRAASAPTRSRPRSGGPKPKPARGAGRDGAAFEILESKLAIPFLRSGLVRRTALVNRLRTASEARVINIATPAGYGKTTLLAQWAGRDNRPFAWVSLEHRDNDPVALLTYVAAALDRIQPLEASVFRAAASHHSIWSSGLPRLGDSLASVPQPIVLVLDDVHELRDRDCLDALESLAKNLSCGSQLVLSGRDETVLPLARLRAAGKLFEVGHAELALSDSEARTLLSAAGAKVSPAEARELNGRTEGWAAGLYLAALFMQESGDPDAIASFHGDDRFVADYLRAEHLSRLKRADLQFLTRVSVLDRMCGGLCDELLERTDSARRLQSLAEANFFVVGLDHHREWYRFHHLFRDLLRAELERLEPDMIATLNRRAAAWCERNGLPEAAIEHAAAGGDVDELARLVGTFALPFYRRGRVVTVERWLELFDEPELLQGYPVIAAFGAWLHALRGRPDDAERYAYALEHSRYDGPMPDGSTSIRPWVAVVQALLCHNGTEAMRMDAELALDQLGHASFWHPVALLLQGIGVLLEGEAERAEPILASAAEEALGAGMVYAGVVAHSELALLALARSDVASAETELAHADEFLQDQPVEDYVPAAIYLAARARLALETRQTASARRLLVRAMRLRPQLSHAIPWFAVQARLELARAHLALADAEGARTLVRETEDVFRHRPGVGSLRQQAQELRGQLANVASRHDGWTSTLTAAELRLLPLLTTHLSFREIAERLYVSRNTVKSQAISVYRKLDASSRSEAIERAVALGLVDEPVSSAGGFTPSG
jgi:LuxR family transcriptional regulator, maltose regulon positive regulatory protein